jgi:nitrate reductase NapAB chaperone NapD
MVFASGFIEVEDIDMLSEVENEVRDRSVEVSGIHQDRILFLIERENSTDTKRALESLKVIKGVRNVYLAYFSLEEQ